jgi:signal transduction histidine kinase
MRHRHDRLLLVQTRLLRIARNIHALFDAKMAENAYEYCVYSKNAGNFVRYYVEKRCSQPATDKLSRC